MSTSRKTYRRKQFFSNPRVQSKVILTFAFLAVLYAATNFYIAKSTLWSFSADVLQLSLSEDIRRDVDLLVQQQSSTLNIQLGVFTMLLVTVVTLGGIVMSHRLGGPIYQLKQYLGKMADGTGKPQRIRFRKLDFFHDLAVAFNTFQE
ncbi:MAG: methyl-accepting chemotaxis protein, partial [Kiritimatiellae bacterium]|nr:methyl-accepting chemotaxis protein [Kiritimatiellia bacterium]